MNCPCCGTVLRIELVRSDDPQDHFDAAEVRRKAWQLEEDRALLREARGDDET